MLDDNTTLTDKNIQLNLTAVDTINGTPTRPSQLYVKVAASADLRLFQGFMALGLIVGIAALGVITSRTVVERRQQVGMLRAIGYQSNMVALSFVLEASFITITGLLIGAVTGLVLANSIMRTFFDGLPPETTFTAPWLQIGLILLGAYLFALLTTIVPAYQAAKVYPAGALRYKG